MDDPLRPKAVPLAAETVLWFEFLLDPELITKHLKKPHPEPSALELMTQFISMTADTMVYDADSLSAGIPVTPGSVTPISGIIAQEGLKISRKQLALKILALKVTTWLKWNLDMLEKNLTIPKQLCLLRDLCTVSFGKLVSIPLTPDFQTKITADGNEHAVRFALTFYHRWVLRLQILKDIAIKSARPTMGNMFVPMEPMHQFFAPEISPQTSIEYLQELCVSDEPFYIFTYDTFMVLHPNSESTEQNFTAMQEISLAELRAQIYFDLVNFYLYTKQYHLAREAVNECRTNLNEIKKAYELESKRPSDFVFCHLNEQELQGYLMACGVSTEEVTLMERFHLAQLTQYKGIIDILLLDNQLREIPLVNRRIVELDIEGSILHGVLKEPRTLEMQVAALNVVRSIFEEGNIFASVDYFEKYQQMDCFTVVIEGFVNVLPHCSLSERNRIKSFLIDCVVKHSNNRSQYLQQVRNISELFSQIELEDLERRIAEPEMFVPTLAALYEWKFNSKLPRIEIGSMERQLISCTNANTVRKMLVKLAATNPTKPLWTVNPSWEIATPIKTLLMSMQRGFLQDFAYVLLGKARELTAKNDYIGAVSMLSVLKSETQRQELLSSTMVTKLGKLVTWEILHIQITQCLEEWNRNTLDLQSLANRCKQCLAATQNGDNAIPRIEIIESCAVMLLNLNDWNSIILLDKRIPQVEIYIAFAATFLDMEKMKGPKKICRDAWDIALATFLTVTSKRGSGPGGSRASPGLTSATGFLAFIKRIRHQSLFSLTISMLGKIHNILKDDPNYDLNGEYMQMWPTTISNPIGYSIRSVSETLSWLITESLKYYPQTIAWLRMQGDLELAIGNNEAAMGCYVNVLVTGTDYCTIPLQRNVADDYVIRKMIRCSSNLGCHMQATVLCQFLDEIDYAIVFKNLTEKSSNFTDAMDAYYNCIWDTTLLEFIINLHAKKGEHSRKLEAISIMGTLELNANNNDEIKREAAAVRKMRFLRALAKQYLI